MTIPETRPEALFRDPPASAAVTFAEKGVVVLMGVVNNALFDLMYPHLCRACELLKQTGREFIEHKLDGDEGGLGAAIIEITAAVAKVEAREFVLAELLLSAYGDHARPTPSLHKDRLASEIAVGIPLLVPDGSTFVHVTDGETEPNPFDSAGRYDDLLDASAKLALQCANLTEVPAGRGDVLLFPGSRWFHGRRNAAGTVVLYAKLNTLGLDPQGLDPRTRAARRRSLELAMDAPFARLAQARVRRAPQLVGLSSFCARNGARIDTAEFKARSVRLNPAELALLHAITEELPVSALPDRVQAGELAAMLRRLVRLGALDLVEEPV